MATQKRPRQRLFDDEPERFWLFSLLGLIVRAVLAYVMGLILYVVAYHLNEMLNMGALDPSLHSSFFFVILALIVGACLIPLLQEQWTVDSRSFALMVGVSIVAIAYAQTMGYTHVDAGSDPGALFEQHFKNYFAPLAHHLGR